MNIVICAGAFEAISGYNHVIRRLADEFRTLGHRVMILCRKPPERFAPGESADDFLRCPSSALLRPRRIYAALERFRPDAVFIHNIDVTDQLGLRFGGRIAVPVFAMCHVKFRHYIRLSIPWRPLRWRIIGWLFERWAAGRMKKADVVFALTEDMRTYLRAMGLERLAVVSCGVDPELLKPETAGPRALPNPEPVNLLYVGQIREMKNQIFLLEMSRFLPDGFHLDLVGGRCWDRIYYRRFVSAVRSGRYPKVRWHGELGRDETAALFRRAHIFLNPSLIEVQNLAQIEAFVAGLPTVRLYGPLTGGVTAHLQTAVHLDERATPEEFAAAVVRLARDGRLYDEISERALAEGARYSWRETAERILEEFDRHRRDPAANSAAG
jgi:glycosyltransferase involved in cell wall biosynthesis